MKILKAPKIDRLYWFNHFFIWFTFTMINFVTRQVANIETLNYGLYSALGILVVNTFVCLIFREVIHRFNLNNARSVSSWIFITLASLFFGLISAVLTLLFISVYLLIAGYVSSIIFFWNSVWPNWIIMSMMILLWAVIYILSNYLIKLKSLELKEKELELDLKKAQLENLIGQVNPHFIFNGLNNIRALMLENVVKSREMITALSELLRYSLQSNQNKFQLIKNEMEMVNNYISLMKIQYEDKLIYNENIDKSILENEVPPMLIQLLVENAIRHGIEQFIGGGELNLSISSVERDIKIVVCNPGVLAPSKDSCEHSGLGIKNIKKRISLLYNGKAKFELVEINRNVVATVTIPKFVDSELMRDIVTLIK